MGQFENTPPALANFSAGFERSDNRGYKFKTRNTLKGLGGRRTLTGFN